ncbi:MAG: ribokinase [Firmicutes bacterium]|nr:ribokinase [Bacillota bacterium]
MKVMFYGSMNIDHTYRVDHIALPGETQPAVSLSVGAGGKGANQCAAFAKALGEEHPQLFFAGKCGEDGRFIKDLLSELGADVSHVASCEHTGSAVIQLDRNGQNSIIIYGGGNTQIEKDEIVSALAELSEGDMLCLNAEINALDFIMEQALEKGLRIVFNPSPITPELRELPLGRCMLLVLNEIEGRVMAELPGGASYEEILEALRAKYPESMIVLTMGSEGSYFAFRETKLRCPVKDTVVADTTCAGDTFLGYFLAGLIEGKAPADCLRLATAASSITVSRPGAMLSVPFRRELDF